METAIRILEALQKARDAQAIAEEAITKAQGQITDIETSLDSVRRHLFLPSQICSRLIIFVMTMRMTMMVMIEAATQFINC